MLRLYNPWVYQGPRRLEDRRNYFEGWYFKMVAPDGRTLAVIPGISLGRHEDGEDASHGFIQIIDGQKGETDYVTFPPGEVSFSRAPFTVALGNNRFSLDTLELGDRLPMKGRVEMSGMRRYGATLLRPGIMGWYRYVPGMECYHGLVSTGHDLKGRLSYGGKTYDLDGGRGYIEKDWGGAFPEAYVWMQCNSFKKKGLSFMLSHARIPWFGRSFWGFLGYLDLGDEIITFSTHTRSVIKERHRGENEISYLIKGRPSIFGDTLGPGEELLITCRRESSGELQAPEGGTMDRRIRESLDGTVRLELRRKGSAPLLMEGVNAGFEMVL